MSYYQQVDSIIDKWVGKHGFALFREFGDRPARYEYLSSDEGECCQISIDSPILFNEISLHASGIETRDDEEMQMHWQVPINELGPALEVAVASVRQWFAR